MKTFIISILFIIPIICFGQKAEKIYSISKKHFPISYYQTQADLWKNKIDIRSGDAEAWDNYYAACRMANLSTKGKEKPYDLEEIINQAKSAIPNSFEYHKIAHWNTNDPAIDWYHLQKATEIDPNRDDIYEGMIAHYVKQDDTENIKRYNQKLFESGRPSPGILAWNYNQLMSVEENAILLTYGDSDTYPSWLLQHVKGVRENVSILNINLLARNPDYRKKIFAKHNIPQLAGGQSTLAIEQLNFTVKLINHLSSTTNRPLYLGVGIDRKIISQLEADLYLVGLAFKYSPTKIDNLVLLKDNIENKFMLDQLNMYFHLDHSESLLNILNGNYLPALVLLYNNYEEVDQAKKQALGKTIEKVAERAGMEDFAKHLMKG